MTALMSKLSLKSLKPGAVGTPEAVNVAELLEEIVAPLRTDATVRIQLKTGPAATVLGVREQIHQVLLNVILNARQAIEGHGEISIVTTQEAQGGVVITVDDTGRGIPPAMLETLFRPSQSSRPGGLGVGLYQCKQIVEAHRGIIQIRSTVGKGTQVRVELPLSTSSPARDSAVAAACSVAPS
jgi:two-component system, NtrC family, sensor histidine kinase HydH